MDGPVKRRYQRMSFCVFGLGGPMMCDSGQQQGWTKALPDNANGGRADPLDRVTWREQVDRFHSWVETASYSDSIEYGLRRAYFLSVLAPDPFWSVLASPCGEEEFEAAVEADNLGEATFKLINPALAIATLTLDGRFHVTVRVAGLAFKGRFASADYSTALLGAWAACIQAIDDDIVAATPQLIDRARHKSQSEPHRP